MAILNRSKIRPDVLKVVEAFQKLQIEGVTQFLDLREDQGLDFQALWKKVMHGNALFFKNKGMTKELSGLVTQEEMHFLAKMHRFTDNYVAGINQERWPVAEDVKVEKTDAGGIPAEWQTVPGAGEERVLLYLHGGGWVLGSPEGHRLLTIELGRATRMRVLSVGYRLAPEHPHPAQLEDCTDVYKWLLSRGIRPKDIIIAGDSAGGSLTLTSLLKLRDDKVPLPSGAVCLSPSTEIAHTDDSYFENSETDPILADIGVFWWVQAYLGGADPSDPLISPLLGDLKGLPPLLFQVSTCEMLYHDSTRFVERARAAGVEATLETWDDMVHVFHLFGLHQLPETGEAIARVGEFAQRLS